MKRAFAYYVKDRRRQLELIASSIDGWIAAGEVDHAVVFCPKKLRADTEAALEGRPAYLFCYEDIQKSNKCYDVTTERTLVVLLNCARYKNISTYVFARLNRLCLSTPFKLIVDIVPFVQDIQYIYLPYSYLDRGILGHQHWYAFRENYFEKLEDGSLIPGLSDENIARKIAPHCRLDYSAFFSNPTMVIDTPLTEPEANEYQEYRDRLFEERSTGSSIVTALADFTNMRESRYWRLSELLDSFVGRTVIYTNIETHNAILKKLTGKEVRTFYDATGDEGEADNIVLFELPIVNRVPQTGQRYKSSQGY
ncbi:MAG: hypothetical protein LUH49_07325, partial [Cloacibacillus porcorum]|uniref:hypothetical protein n=1 Tax=Cloacibacillus porcorum TaxID=1197717 RepID=UPI0023F4020F